ncbi:glycosyltransferase family 87 protein [Allonocardiopsis opalescens]|uniref:Putative membrane protein n=1 Tax=Allonocardiopsis opalescens TaxID=1144618 RepID=A0A2T0Q6V1_9ACTN|nr:glycosyltransferase 87 family protein [Allonocardiopsis opalescens]PRX99545.1 putative membrane protein [Allonocardiopsis opalescens]
MTGESQREHGAGGPTAGTGASAVRELAPYLLLASVAGLVLAYLAKAPCRFGGHWEGAGRYAFACYTDVYPLYYGYGFTDGVVPYLQYDLEYPVLIGAVMFLLSSVVGPIEDAWARGFLFFDLTALLMGAFLVVAVFAVAAAAGDRRRMRSALFMALAPGTFLAAFINWDLMAVALSVLFIVAWGARRPALAGVLLGAAIAAKFYPLVFLGPLFLLCLRAGRLRAFFLALATTAGTWLALNLPVMLAAPHGWSTFFVFSSERMADWGSIWYALQEWGVQIQPDQVNTLGTGSFVLACTAIAVVALCAPRRPRLTQLLFLVVAAFLLTNKVWSPQFVLWLVPLAVLARPRFGALGLWQLAEIGYFVGIWWYLLSMSGPEDLAGLPVAGIGFDVYGLLLLGRFAAVALLCALVLADVFAPGRDPVRAGGVDDPSGGVLSDAPDRFAWGVWAGRAARVPAGSA